VDVSAVKASDGGVDVVTPHEAQASSEIADIVVELHDVTRRYPQGDSFVEVLHGITLSLSKGEFAALIGSSGSGKSTLLHLLGLLDSPTSGSYSLNGVDTTSLDENQRSALRGGMIGFVFQNFFLLPYATALENVLLPGSYVTTPSKVLEERASSLLEQVGLADRMDYTPARLSGGQQQRVALARALLHGPDILLADEPTGQLDSVTGHAILELFGTINAGGTTVVIVTHDAQVAAAANRCINIVDGRVA